MEFLPEESNYLGIEEKHSNYKNSKIVILSAPLEATVSYGGGTGNGPEEILKASHYVEFYDEETDRELCFEKGICTLPPLNLSGSKIEESLSTIEDKVKTLLNDDKFVVTLGGEHSLSSAPAKAHFEKFDSLSILQIDAHSDFRDEYEGSKFSHASVMARVAEFTIEIVQVGIRAQCKEESEFIKKENIKTFYAREIRQNTNWIDDVVGSLKENVYVTFDIDGFDPSLVPATGTPEPGGLFWDETMDLFKKIGQEKNIVGFDLVELAPAENQPASNFIAAKLVYKLLNYAFAEK